MKIGLSVFTLAFSSLSLIFAFYPNSYEVIELAGEEVYISEGCIHCHSQYSRRDTMDLEWSGPASFVPSGNGERVLIGNRRQGPDLSNIGLRRSKEWNRAHLIDPQGISPGSSMPSYRHLFVEGDERGERLLEYLDSLKTNEVSIWYEQVNRWTPEKGLNGDLGKGEASFAKNCAQCHGETAEGNGPMSDRFHMRPRDLKKGEFRFIPDGMDQAWKQRRWQQIVKYGIQGTSMPGHEYLTDQEIVDLVVFAIDL